MILIPFLALLVGILLGTLVMNVPMSREWATYVAVASLAGIDTICGGLRSNLESKFHTDIFITGFISNIVIAFFLAWLGDKIGINLFLVCALIFGSRIFTNLSLIRRFLLTKWQDARQKRREQAQQAQQQSQQGVKAT